MMLMEVSGRKLYRGTSALVRYAEAACVLRGSGGSARAEIPR